MVQDGTVGIDNGNKEEKVKPPNRNAFQRELSRLNGEIEFLHNQAKIKLNREGNPGSIYESRNAKEAIRGRREILAQEAKARKLEILALREPLDTLKKGRQEVEKDCRVRSVDKLEDYLKRAEQRYKEQNLSVKEEKHLVEEIDALKRNRTKLEKVAEFNAKIVVIEAQVEQLKRKNKEVYNEILRLKAEQHGKFAEEHKRTDEWLRIQAGLDQVHGQKRQLIAKYTEQRTDYSEWIKSHRKKALSANSTHPATFPSRARTISCSLVEDEELEPFFEQKRDCKRLIIYLEKLKSQMELPESVMSSPPTAESDSDSADEFPSSFARLGVQNKMEPPKSTDTLPKEKRKAPNARKIKPSQAISHMYDTYNLFAAVEVTVPVNYQDVPRALEEVRERALFFDKQTNIINWYEELGNGEEIVMPSMSRSVSEYTGDSAIIDSETASLSSSRLNPTSPSDLRNHRNLSFNADEGISSRDSQPEFPSLNK